MMGLDHSIIVERAGGGAQEARRWRWTHRESAFDR
jgi:hypothetical protein